MGYQDALEKLNKNWQGELSGEPSKMLSELVAEFYGCDGFDTEAENNAHTITHIHNVISSNEQSGNVYTWWHIEATDGNGERVKMIVEWFNDDSVNTCEFNVYPEFEPKDAPTPTIDDMCRKLAHLKAQMNLNSIDLATEKEEFELSVRALKSSMFPRVDRLAEVIAEQTTQIDALEKQLREAMLIEHANTGAKKWRGVSIKTTKRFKVHNADGVIAWALANNRQDVLKIETRNSVLSKVADVPSDLASEVDTVETVIVESSLLKEWGMGK